VQLRHLAKIRAMVVLPVRAGRKAVSVGNGAFAQLARQRLVTFPAYTSEALRTVFACYDLIPI